MAVLLLPIAAAAFSSAAGLAGTIFASALGAVASVAGGYLDSLLFPPKPQVIKNEGPRLQQSQLTTSSEGAPIKRMWGKVRLGGQVIWQTRFREEAVTTTTTQRTGKSGQRQSVTQTQTVYNYYANFAVALCEGPVYGLGRIWADGKLLNPNDYVFRFYPGDYTQNPDPKIEAVEGAGKTPAYRGLCYVVFDEMLLVKFGNRMPQITCEVFKPLVTSASTLEVETNAVAMITEGEFTPGTSEYIATSNGNSTALNVINGRAAPSIRTSLDDLKTLMPNVNKVNMIVPWFGADQRAQQCRVRPKVDTTSRTVTPADWVVSGLTRTDLLTVFEGSEHILTQSGGGRHFNATPSDRALREALVECNTRGLQVMFTCDLKMDIPIGNTLQTPYGGGGNQNPYPDSSTITCNPHRGVGGSVDGTSDAETQVAWFFGDANRFQFNAWDGTTIPFTGPAGWGYRRMVLHYAHLCASAGGVESFNVGSGLTNLMQIRGARVGNPSAAFFPAVQQLAILINDVKAILPGAKVSYSADWREWNGFNPGENGSGADFYSTYYHHLDPVWAVADYVGIEYFAPLSDWRSTQPNEDADEGLFSSEYDPLYLSFNVQGAEHYNWRYRNAGDRFSQVRQDITDLVGGEDYQYRRKDLQSWWFGRHFDRENNQVFDFPTPWLERSRRFRLTKVGCPAIDKGSNDPTSLTPPFSTGGRDDVIQRSYIEAVIKYWKDPLNNPVGPQGPMVETGNIYAYAWDARSYPDFPERTDLFPDASDFDKGYWLTGRAGSPSLAELVRQIMQPTNVEFDVSGLYGGATQVDGYLIEQVASVRETLQPLETVFFFDSFESEGTIKFSLRIRRPRSRVTGLDLVSQENDKGGFEITRNQESDLPGVVKVQYMDPAAEYQTAAVDSRRLIGNSEHTEQIAYPVTLSTDYAKLLADAFLQEAWMKRETITMSLPNSFMQLDPGDVIEFEQNDDSEFGLFRITKVSTGQQRTVEGHSYDESVYPTTR